MEQDGRAANIAKLPEFLGANLVTLGRRGQTFRTRRHVHWTDSWTGKLVGRTQCSDAKPNVDTNQNQHSDTGHKQGDLAHVTYSALNSHSNRAECKLAQFAALACHLGHNAIVNIAKLPELLRKS
jgi:hypothetical protein